ncbi:MAG: LacI family DNA-binding transcriptional regulator [Verrucomicrobia bacterium]|nr:LacI family DNA-binding transcriptional regulator [Verrucomicrobiota bacterium]
MPTPPAGRPNMQQIADAAAVSKSAVSLALRNDPRIPESTRTRIQQIAEKMGYQRNPVVDTLMSQLRAGRQPGFQANLALINCAPFEDLNSNHTFRRLREGVLERSRKLGYGVEEFWLQKPDLRPQRLKQILETRGIRGIVLIGILGFDEIDDEKFSLFYKKFACSVIGTAQLNKRINCSTNDQYLTARRVTRKVLKMGYERPILVVPEADDAVLENKFSAGFYSIVKSLPKRDQLEVVSLDLESLPQAIETIKARKADVIITNQSELYYALQDTAFRIPEELGVVHLDWHAELKEMAGMRQNNKVVGQVGVDLVVGQLQRNEFGAQEFPQVVEIESIWVDGTSVRKPPVSA